MIQRFSTIRVLVATTALAALGCRDVTEPSPTAPRSPEVAPLHQLRPQAQVPDPTALARSIPGFGGLFLAGDGVPTVYLTDPAQRGAAEQSLAAFARARGVSPSEIRVLQGKYDHRQLGDWFDAASLEALAVDGAIFTDLDEANNRVLIGVEDHGAIGRVRAALARTTIPEAAVAIEIREPVRFAATLQQLVRPIVAGVQIHFSQYLCSLGFNSRDGSQDSFITASHCTAKQGGVEGTKYYQPLSSVDPTVIATEVEDPQYFRGGACPKGKKCRYSDASRARYSTGFTAFTLGGIAQTSGPNNGSLVITGTFSVGGANTTGDGLVGQVVNKVGRTTGWTQGQITNTCVNTGVQGTNIVQLCQTFVAAGVGGGDSGSGVFSGTSNVTIEGVLWGGSGSSLYVYSPFGRVQQELGTLTVK